MRRESVLQCVAEERDEMSAYCTHCGRHVYRPVHCLQHLLQHTHCLQHLLQHTHSVQYAPTVVDMYTDQYCSSHCLHHLLQLSSCVIILTPCCRHENIVLQQIWCCSKYSVAAATVCTSVLQCSPCATPTPQHCNTHPLLQTCTWYCRTYGIEAPTGCNTAATQLQHSCN